MVEPAPPVIGKENVDEYLPGGDTRPAPGPGVPVTPVDRVAAASPGGVRSRPEGQAQPPRGAPVVEGDVPDRRRLLLHPELPARHRRTRGGRGVPTGDIVDRGADPVRDAAN